MDLPAVDERAALLHHRQSSSVSSNENSLIHSININHDDHPYQHQHPPQQNLQREATTRMNNLSQDYANSNLNSNSNDSFDNWDQQFQDMQSLLTDDNTLQQEEERERRKEELIEEGVLEQGKMLSSYEVRLRHYKDIEEDNHKPLAAGIPTPFWYNWCCCCCCFCCTRHFWLSCLWLLVIILFVVMFVAIAHFANEIDDLQQQVATQAATTRYVVEELHQHSTVIARFNTSVTNKDVVEKLHQLEATLNGTEAHIMQELRTTEESIGKELDQTKQDLHNTVQNAEHDIADQVNKVKHDVDQYVITTQDQFSMENSFMVYQLAGTFTLLSCLISMWHMTAHLRKLNQPDVQRKILAILWMCPIYAVTSWFSLVFHQAEGYLAIIKDFYEAYIIYQFLSFCIAVLGRGDRNAVVDLLANHADHLTPPFRLLGVFEICGWCVPEPYENNRALADAILLQCQFFAMQFVFLRPLITLSLFLLDHFQYYGGAKNAMDYRAPQLYLNVLQNVSIFIAFAGLLKFYHAVDKDLAWCRPLPKFLCIKGVVFMTFWQGLVITFLANTTNAAGDDDVTEWAKSAQSFLICLEMLLFSVAHFYCFPTEEWQPGYRVKKQDGGFGDSIALGDFFQDMKLILTANARKGKRKKKHKRNANMSAERTISEEEDDDTDAGSTARSDDDAVIANVFDASFPVDENDEDGVKAAKQRLMGNRLLSGRSLVSPDDKAASTRATLSSTSRSAPTALLRESSTTRVKALPTVGESSPESIEKSIGNSTLTDNRNEDNNHKQDEKNDNEQNNDNQNKNVNQNKNDKKNNNDVNNTSDENDNNSNKKTGGIVPNLRPSIWTSISNLGRSNSYNDSIPSDLSLDDSDAGGGNNSVQNGGENQADNDKDK